MKKTDSPAVGIYETESIEQMKARLAAYRKLYPVEERDWRDIPCGICRPKYSPEWK
jgi:hypothetical protein